MPSPKINHPPEVYEAIIRECGRSPKPLRYSLFASIMLRQHGRDYPGLEPRYYEIYYVAGHQRGEHDAVQLYQYALNHGETRAPSAPVMAEYPPSS